MKDENEIFDEKTRKEIDEKLQNNENINLPESLSKESVERLAAGTEQKAEEKPKAQRINYFVSFGAIVAALALAVTLLIASPLTGTNGTLPKIGGKNVDRQSGSDKDAVVPDDYSEIENLFAALSENYNAYLSDDRNFRVVEENVRSADIGAAVDENGSSYDEGVNAYNKTESLSAHGETNEQVQGVSEADILKNDGEYIYTVRNDYFWDYDYDEKESSDEVKEFHCIDITRVGKDGTLTKVSSVPVSYDATVHEMYVSGDKLIVLTNDDGYNDDVGFYLDYYWGNQRTTVSVFDISDRKSPVFKDSFTQDGYYISSRLIGDRLVLMSDYCVYLDSDGDVLKEKCVPEVCFNGGEDERIAVNDICVTAPVMDSSYLVVSNINIDNCQDVSNKAVLGAGGNVYCTEKTLYVAGTVYEQEDMLEDVFCVVVQDTSETEIMKFDISDGKTDFLASGKVDGYMLNQFSMDEYNGYLRVASTTGWWGENAKNQLYVLDSSLQVVGSIENIAKGEIARSVRFSGNTGYLVTFEQTDPLFVIDLTDPASPAIVGELKLPGYSSYLHPVSDNLLLGVGFEGDEEGVTGETKFSLFDVSDPQNPVEVDKYILTGKNGETPYYNYSYNYSDDYYNVESYEVTTAATYDHKAFCFDSASGTVYVPVQTQYFKSEYDANETIIEEGALVLKVNAAEKKLSEEKKLLVPATTPQAYISYCTRATFTGDTVIVFDSSAFTLISFNGSGENVSTLELK